MNDRKAKKKWKKYYEDQLRKQEILIDLDKRNETRVLNVKKCGRTAIFGIKIEDVAISFHEPSLLVEPDITIDDKVIYRKMEVKDVGLWLK